MRRAFCRNSSGENLEYTLLMAFVALASAASFIGAGGSIKGIWSPIASLLPQAIPPANLNLDWGGGPPPRDAHRAQSARNSFPTLKDAGSSNLRITLQRRFIVTEPGRPFPIRSDVAMPLRESIEIE